MTYAISLAPNGSLRLWYTDTLSVDIPSTYAGVKILALILTEGTSTGDHRIGHKSMPTQSQIEKWLEVWQQSLRAQAVPAALAKIKEFNL
jgi:hypothetical protein